MTTTISHIRNYLDRLDAIDFAGAYSTTRQALDNIIFDVVQHPEIRFKKPNHLLQEHSRDMDSAASDIQRVLAGIRERCHQLIAEAEPDYYDRSTRWYHEESRFENAEYIVSRKMVCDAADLIEWESRIRRYISWQWPGMVIRPSDEPWADMMVAMEPLYLVDTMPDLFAPVRRKFTEQYQRRLRYYTIDEWNESELLGELPQGQFGLIAAWNFLNFKPIEVIEQYLEDFYAVLRPGGTVIFTFNDCDHEQGVRHCEPSVYMPYTPGTRIQNYAEHLGFAISQRYRGIGDVSWLELRKSGKLTTLKAASTMATLVDRSK